LATNCMQMLSIGQTDCTRVQQTVGQTINKTESLIFRTY